MAHSLRDTVHPGEVGVAMGMTQLAVQQEHGATRQQSAQDGSGTGLEARKPACMSLTVCT